MFREEILLPFVDTLFILCLFFMYISQEEAEIGKAVEDKKIPTVFVYLETDDGKFRARCNGHIVSPYQLTKIIELAPEKGVTEVQIDFLSEGKIEIKKFIPYKTALERMGITYENLKISWNIYLTEIRGGN